MSILHGKKLTALFVTGLLSFSVSCGTDEEEEAIATAGQAAGTATADSLDDLQISTALNLTLPDALGGDSSGAGLALQSSTKSSEACEVGQVLKNSMSSLQGISNMFCHLEVESAQIEFGTKYDITLQGLGENDQDAGMGLQIWVDNSAADSGELTVWMCQNDNLTQMFTITGVDEDGAKGSIINSGSEEEEGGTATWAEDVTFDLNYTEEGRSFLNVRSKFAMGDSDAFSQHVVIDLLNEGVSNLRLSRNGAWEGNSFEQMGAAKHNGDYGQVLFSNIFTPSEGDAHDFVRRANFNSEGFVVDATSITALGSDGELYVADSDVPKTLEANFTPSTFPTDAWDCSTDVAITVDMSGENGAAHNACDEERNDTYIDCYAEEYQSSQEEHTIDETQQVENSEFDDIKDDESD